MKTKKIFNTLLVIGALLASCSQSNNNKTEFASKQEVKDFVSGKNLFYNNLTEAWGKGNMLEPTININNNIGDHCVKVTWDNVKCNGKPVTLCFKYDLNEQKPKEIYPLYSWSDSFPEHND